MYSLLWHNTNFLHKNSIPLSTLMMEPPVLAENLRFLNRQYFLLLLILLELVNLHFQIFLLFVNHPVMIYFDLILSIHSFLLQTPCSSEHTMSILEILAKSFVLFESFLHFLSYKLSILLLYQYLFEFSILFYYKSKRDIPLRHARNVSLQLIIFINIFHDTLYHFSICSRSCPSCSVWIIRNTKPFNIRCFTSKPLSPSRINTISIQFVC